MTNTSVPESIKYRFMDDRIAIERKLVKCIASCVRANNIPWEKTTLSTGLGKEGDLVLVECLSDTGSINTLENLNGGYIRLYKGDLFVTALANRYSGTSEAGYIPAKGLPINKNTEVTLLSRAGIVGILKSLPSYKKDFKPFNVKILGLIKNENKTINLFDTCGVRTHSLNKSAPMVLIFGTSAEVGKTTTTVSIIRSLVTKKLKVAALKVSGSGGIVETLNYRDAGAFPWLGPEDVGLPTTYTSPERFTFGLYTMINHANSYKPDIIVAETGGDPIESNLPTLLADKHVMRNACAIIIVAGDVLGMMGITSYLKKYIGKLPVFYADPKDRNQLSTRERVKEQIPEAIMFNSIDSKEVSNITSIIQRRLSL